ncbi:hypothetical protein L198_07164 [Cryptococcus wingfieldii CBS 7118]|uniref:Uncharacterized protein n=1 Tax=Cryptococcus wingfieldii CBS 7118 TaxID=1295528 RepID=A0A1E3IDU6_9TREE|nr:hypothetical protein L198_07164 [Cryptococcus wingfieldii CBS 7118]ODN86802.1 hypothetical protein L198_07164 [Cryptococcus wingfieldii CBS 7118]
MSSTTTLTIPTKTSSIGESMVPSWLRLHAPQSIGSSESSAPSSRHESLRKDASSWRTRRDWGTGRRLGSSKDVDRRTSSTSSAARKKSTPSSVATKKRTLKDRFLDHVSFYASEKEHGRSVYTSALGDDASWGEKRTFKEDLWTAAENWTKRVKAKANPRVRFVRDQSRVSVKDIDEDVMTAATYRLLLAREMKTGGGSLYMGELEKEDGTTEFRAKGAHWKLTSRAPTASRLTSSSFTDS